MTDERKSEIKQWLRDTISELTYGSMNIVVSSCAYDDVFDASTIAEAYNEAEYIDTFLDDKLYYSDREYELFDEISSKSEKKSLDFKNEFLDFCKDYDYNVPEILEAGGFEGVSNDIESFFDSYRVNIMFATRTEQNSDMTSITYAYPRDYGDVNVQAYTEEVYKDITDNALTYLVHQQGHSILEVYNAMSEVYDTMNSEKNSSDSFITQRKIHLTLLLTVLLRKSLMHHMIWKSSQLALLYRPIRSWKYLKNSEKRKDISLSQRAQLSDCSMNGAAQVLLLIYSLRKTLYSLQA